jgi:hypothetical protein
VGNGATAETEAPATSESRRQQRLPQPTATAPAADSTLYGWLKGVDGRRWKVVNAAGMALGGLAASIWADAFAGGWGTATGTLLFIVAAGLGLGGASGWSLLALISRSRQVQELVDVF